MHSEILSEWFSPPVTGISLWKFVSLANKTAAHIKKYKNCLLSGSTRSCHIEKSQKAGIFCYFCARIRDDLKDPMESSNCSLRAAYLGNDWGRIVLFREISLYPPPLNFCSPQTSPKSTCYVKVKLGKPGHSRKRHVACWMVPDG